MKYLIDTNDICDIVEEVFFSHDDYGYTLLDKYRKRVEWINNMPDDIMNTSYAEFFKDIKVDDFKKELISRAECVWTDGVEKKLKEVLKEWEYNEE